MKPRHAAALALVVWYLMVAPYRSGVLNRPDAATPASSLYDFGAPISSWIKDRSFYTEADCASGKASRYRKQSHAYQRSNLRNAPLSRTKTAAVNQMALFEHAQCIASDDPRLKGN